jgi:hypothetical protein
LGRGNAVHVELTGWQQESPTDEIGNYWPWIYVVNISRQTAG